MSNKENELPSFDWNSADWDQLQNIMTAASEQSQAMIHTYMEGLTADSASATNADPLNIAQSFLDFTSQMVSEPQKLIENQMSLFQDYAKLWDYTAKKQAGEEVNPVIDTGRDKRFKGQEWSENTTFDFIKQAYLLMSKHVMTTVNNAQGLDSKEQQKVDFYMRQMVDAMSPSNFILTNPEVLQATMDSKGDNLIKGMNNMLKDMKDGGDSMPLISMVDKSQFEVGKNVAVTPGKVVFRNDMLELIQYAPTTETVQKVPMLIFPPWINKFYILDLNTKKSLVQWLTNQGFTTFMVSWVNPKTEHRTKGLEAYLQEGYVEAMKVVQEITGEKSIHATGYCVGGTMLATALAYLHGSGQGDMVKSATFLTTLTNFETAGEITVFIDEEQINAIKEKMKPKGYLDGKAMALTFNMLRSNDLIWSYMVNNYLLGKDPMAFDLLYWNCDSTNQAEACHSEYLENMYLNNLLKEPGGITLSGVDIDLSKIDTPCYILATKDDHIAPADSVYDLRNIISGPAKFVLGGSGHIAGVVNPPLDGNSGGKYQFWENDAKADDLMGFMAGATEHSGSWWPHWVKWLSKRSRTTTAPRIPGEGGHKALMDAPGSYVQEKV